MWQSRILTVLNDLDGGSVSKDELVQQLKEKTPDKEKPRVKTRVAEALIPLLDRLEVWQEGDLRRFWDPLT